ncbi:ribosome silencing factor [Lactobacillus gigeriorum]|uniref:Ribosomal silencing factor RsfS n=1 Tax=Lactobacillus gigeriorum DSM 23908 = CRBIP 24.85 TaxID=1423751 RepID=I7LEV4_9LACO|nr:ribosome silencing factor [Lactobacillus gigeriorum]KRN14152.1 Iojap family protein [Lactobacillus gigeriorum DSM 23908 = CRBIP 24.85]CCI86113.1 Iojap family protein [Lactobacillus gigeriorum DSM 23908 = CRBIP 24.85]
MTSTEILDFVAKAISDRHGEDTEAYDMRGISVLADYYVVTSAGSNRQLHAIANSIIDEAHQLNYYNYRIEGTRDSNWLLIDLGDVVVNIFTKDAREFYNLEKLWLDGKKVELKED